MFLLIYVIKTVLLFSNKTSTLQSFTKKVKVPEMIISTLFLLTGIFLAMSSGSLGTWFYVKIIAVLAAIPIAIIGFKKANKGMALVSLLLIVYSYGISETKSPVMKKPTVKDKYAKMDYEQLGVKIYVDECSRCHGADGKLGKSAATDLSATVLNEEGIRAKIKIGGKTMPVYEQQLSPDEINAVAAYVFTLKANKQ